MAVWHESNYRKMPINYDRNAPGPGTIDDPTGLSIFTALKEQLGLKLESAKGPVEILVID